MTAGIRTYSKTTYMALCGLFAALTAVCSYISIPLGFTPVPVNLATLAVFLAGGLLGKKYGTVALAVYALIGAVGVPVFSEFRGGLSVLAGPTGGYIIGYIAAAFIVGLLIEVLMPWASGGRGFGGNATADRSAAGKEFYSEDASLTEADTAAGRSTVDNEVSSEDASLTGADATADSDTTSRNDETKGGTAFARSGARELIVCVIAMVAGLAACYLLGTLWFMISTHTGAWAALVMCVFPFLPGDALKIAAGALLVQRLRHIL